MRQDQLLTFADHPEYIGVETVTGKSYLYCVVRENSTISSVIDEDGYDFINDIRYAGKTLIAGIDIIKAPNGKRISAITVTGGSLVGASDK